MNQTTARGRAIAAQDRAIDQNIAKIEAAKTRPTPIQQLASNLAMSAEGLQRTLRQTVFRDASDAEFAALVVVSAAYNLNPLLKEIFAFKAKGGGVIPYVSVDGWIRIINEHPQFDGVEFNDILDEDGEMEAIECVIYRKDRTRPIKVTEYMDECRRRSDPWDKSPKRFLRHRALMQCGRVAFGFSGISAEGDYEVIPYAPDVPDARNVTPPTRQQTARDQQPVRETIDADTGEFTPVDDDDAAELDRQSLREMDGGGDDEEDQDESVDDMAENRRSDPSETTETAENRQDANRSDSGPRTPSTDAQWATWWKGVKAKVDKAPSVVEVQRLKTKFQPIIDAAPDDLAGDIATTFKAAEASFSSAGAAIDWPVWREEIVAKINAAQDRDAVNLIRSQNTLALMDAPTEIGKAINNAIQDRLIDFV